MPSPVRGITRSSYRTVTEAREGTHDASDHLSRLSTRPRPGRRREVGLPPLRLGAAAAELVPPGPDRRGGRRLPARVGRRPGQLHPVRLFPLPPLSNPWQPGPVMDLRDYTFLGTTRSLCPHCRRLVDAKIVV